MKSIIVYYSYSGNTEKVAGILAEVLTGKGEVQQAELLCPDESKTFLGQCRRAISHKRGMIGPLNFNLGAYDLICLGTPVWAFGPAPAVNTFLDKCFGVEGKNIVLFTTYGSGAGRERCINYMQDILAKKGASKFRRFSIQQLKVNDKDFVISAAKEAL